MSDLTALGSPQLTAPARFWHLYTSFVADIDLTADANGPTGQYTGKCARMLIVTDLGTGSVLEVEREDGAVEQLDVSLLVGVRLPGVVATITDTTDIGGVLVYW